MASNTLMEGLKTRSPSSDDASTKIKGGSVNQDAVRSKPAPNQPAPGPRTA